MAARLIDGKAYAQTLKDEVRQKIVSIADHAEGRIDPITLAAVQIDGGPEGVDVYAASQKRCAESVGIAFHHVRLTAGSTEEALIERIDSLNRNPAIHGILLLRPLPDGIDGKRMSRRIRPDKDVEGQHPANLGALVSGSARLIPCTAHAALRLLHSTGIEVRGLETVVVGHSEIVGKPIALFMVNALSTVTTCHIATVDLAAHTRRADILFAAAGVAGLITGDMIKPGAIVIDIGINQISVEEKGVKKTKIVGDVDFASALDVAGWITPVPGGVGPVTTVMLMKNTVEAFGRVTKIEFPP